MKRLVWVRTAPPDWPGSMTAFAELVGRAAGVSAGWEFSTCDLFDPRGGGAMWRHHVWRGCHGRRELARHPADIYHWLDGSMAAFIPDSLLGRSLVTVHDLIPLLQGRGQLPGRPSLPASVLIHRGVRALRGCAGLSVDSRATGRDLARWAGIVVPPVVIPVPVREFPAARPVPGMKDWGRFILHVGNNATYKNRAGVLRVFAHLQDIPDLHLVMAGPEPVRPLRGFAAGLQRVHFIGPVADDQLGGLYRQAAVFLFPSLYEGYGMPVLEAMAAGCPVVCSTAEALLEVAGEAALPAPADEPAALAAACRRLLTEDPLRREFIVRGRARAAAFDIASMGRSLLNWYEQALEQKESHG